ncbi:MAG: ribonuclease catalytic domain-containing protein [Desulfohalobiaceae bacterium]
MSIAQQHLEPGCILEYMQDSQPILACILEATQKQIRVLNINKRLLKLPQARVLPWTGPTMSPQSSREDILQELQGREHSRRSLISDIDALELWELVQDEADQVSIHWLASLLWQEPGPDQVAALGRTLLQYKTHFKFIPPGFKPNDATTVQARLWEQEKVRKKNQVLAQGQALFQALWAKQAQGQSLELPKLDPEIANELQRLLFLGISDPESSEFQDYWKQLSRGLPDNPNLPLLLAQYWGLVPSHYNHLLDQAGYSWGNQWSMEFSQEVQRQEHKFQNQEQVPEDLGLFSIDSSSTQDIDDAFCLAASSDHGFELQLAVACPVLEWEFGSDLDQAVAHRFSSLYLPEGTTHMLPEELGTQLFSLHAGRSRPVLLLQLSLDQEGTLQQVQPRLTWTSLRENLTYTQVETSLEQGQGSVELNLALHLARLLRSKRIQQGAVIIEQEEPLLRLWQEQDQVQVELKEPSTHPQAQLMVSEFMILANQALAIWAKDRDLPMLYRTQDIQLSRDYAGVWQDPVNIFKVMREMSGSRLDHRPRPHASLGAQAYAPVTSPLRRYSDFLNLAQVFYFLRQGRALLSSQDLERKIPYLSARAQEAARIQKFRTRYWKLLYLQTWCKQRTWHGVVVSEEGPMVTVSLPREQILLRAPAQIFGDKLLPGKAFQLKLGRIDPLNNDIKILDAWEE